MIFIRPRSKKILFQKKSSIETALRISNCRFCLINLDIFSNRLKISFTQDFLRNHKRGFCPILLRIYEARRSESFLILNQLALIARNKRRRYRLSSKAEQEKRIRSSVIFLRYMFTPVILKSLKEAF